MCSVDFGIKTKNGHQLIRRLDNSLYNVRLYDQRLTKVLLYVDEKQKFNIYKLKAEMPNLIYAADNLQQCRNKKRPITRVWQKWRFSTPQTVLWLIKVWFSASTFVVKIATFAKPETVSSKRLTTIMKRQTYIIFALFLITAFTSCTLDNDALTKKVWKFGDGYWLGDILYFSNKTLRNDTLYGVDSAFAVVYKTERRFFADNKVYIKSLKTGEIGTYYEK